MSYHLHIDAFQMDREFETYSRNTLGFWRSNFCGHPPGAEAYEPPNHLTYKTKSAGEFRSVFASLRKQAETSTGFRGYLEGEFIASDRQIQARPFDSSVEIPFRVHTTPLEPGTFREDEVHITLSRDLSDNRLLDRLTEIGLFAAYLPKPNGVAQIFTIQGSRKNIGAILPSLTAFLERAGGAVDCSIKEERVIDWWMSEPGLRLPPVIAEVDWNQAVSVRRD